MNNRHNPITPPDYKRLGLPEDFDKWSQLAIMDLAVLTLVDETHSFRVTAKKLHIVQSAISQRVERLEHWLGYQIFNRRKGGSVTPTLEADPLITFARRSMKHIDLLQRCIDAIEGRTYNRDLGEETNGKIYKNESRSHN